MGIATSSNLAPKGIKKVEVAKPGSSQQLVRQKKLELSPVEGSCLMRAEYALSRLRLSLKCREEPGGNIRTTWFIACNDRPLQGSGKKVIMRVERVVVCEKEPRHIRFARGRGSGRLKRLFAGRLAQGWKREKGVGSAATLPFFRGRKNSGRGATPTSGKV